MKSNSPERSEAEANKMHCEDTKTQIQTHTVTVTIIISVLIKATGGKSHITATVHLYGPKFCLMVKRNPQFFIIEVKLSTHKDEKIKDVLFLFLIA